MATDSIARMLSPEFWAIIGSAVTLLVAIVGVAALILTVAGWIREDIRSMDARLGGLDSRMSSEIKAIDTKLSKEIRAIDTKLSKEIRAIDTSLRGEFGKIDSKVAVIDKRLAVVESHVLAARRIVHAEPSDKT